MKTVLQHGTLLDVVNDRSIADASIYMVDGRIEAIENGDAPIRDGYETIDLTGKYIIPGMVDIHQHIHYTRTYGNLWEQMKLNIPALTIRSIKNMLAELRMGITTVRSGGDVYDIDRTLRAMVEHGYIMGPRMLICGKPLAITGSHVPDSFAQWVDGVDEFTKWTRERASRYDWVKVFGSYGLTKPYYNGEYERPEITLTELKAVCDAAHNAQKKVMIHCSGSAAVEIAMHADVDTIEHGTGMTFEQAQYIKEHNIAYVPTMTAKTETLNPISDRGAQWIEDQRKFIPFSDFGLKNAVKAGVLISMGLDSLGVVGDEARQFEEIGGMGKWDVLRACTLNGAKTLDMEDEIGSVEPGKFADIAVLNSDPFESWYNLEDVYMVVSRGVVRKVEDIGLTYEFESRDYNSIIPELYI